MENPVLLLERWLSGLRLPGWLATALAELAALIAVLVLALVCLWLSRRFLGRGVGYLIRKSRTRWDDAFMARGAFRRLSHLVPALILYLSAPLFGSGEALLQRLSLAYMILAGLMVLMALANAAVDIYQTFEVARFRPIKSFVEVAKIVLSIVVSILVLAMLLGREPWLLLSGLGAMTAVLLLVFKDSLLGLVAGVQLTLNHMVAIGDWIEMPKYGADGDVIDISLHTVKVRNWDKTITTIPSYALVSDSFKNWRGMSESGGRRIKRAVLLDMASIRFLTEADVERLSRILLLGPYLEQKRAELAAHNAQIQADPGLPINGRRLTNLGTFRAYVAAYLRRHPQVHQDMTFLVRHLDPTPQGLPLEIYVFSRDQVWANYENIQADIFDHVLAAAPVFDLRVFQAPSSGDVARLGEALARRVQEG
jgi:miniconductance mechanosensitive channel